MANKKRKGFRRIKQARNIHLEKTSNRAAKRKTWSNEQMTAAMECAKAGRMSINRSAEVHGVPRSTLKDRLSGRVQHGTKPGPVPYLSQTEEGDLCSYLLSSADVGYGKTRREVKGMVELVAQEKKILRASKISDGWWRRFLERNPMLSLRSGDATANIRMDAVNEETMTSYFNLLKDLYEELNLADHPECIYNMDETGVPLEPRPPKVITRKGTKKVRYRTSRQKAQITVIGCGNATGQSIPPFIIFSAKQLNPLWMRDEIAGSRFAVSDKGWTDKELFFFWLKDHFLPNSVSFRPLLLLLDGHSSHFEPSTIRYAKENDCVIFCLPPHTTHECQPLDCSFFGPLKNYWRDTCHTFYQKHPSQVISKLNFCSVFREAWLKAITPENIIGGFRKSGVYPFNPDAVSLVHQKKNSKDDRSAKEPPTTQVDLAEDVARFSFEQEELYRRRYEECYDFYDSSYVEWLKAHHPEAVRAEWLTIPPAPVILTPIPEVATAVVTPPSDPEATAMTPVPDPEVAVVPEVTFVTPDLGSSPVSKDSAVVDIDLTTGCSPISPLANFLSHCRLLYHQLKRLSKLVC